jgi:hypothetical protein
MDIHVMCSSNEPVLDDAVNTKERATVLSGKGVNLLELRKSCLAHASFLKTLLPGAGKNSSAPG